MFVSMEGRHGTQTDKEKKRREKEMERNVNKCLISGMKEGQRGRISGLPCSPVHTQTDYK